MGAVIGQSIQMTKGATSNPAAGFIKVYVNASGVVSVIDENGNNSKMLLDTNNLSDIASANLARVNLNQGLVSLGTLSGNISSNCSLGNVFTVTLSGASTLINPTNLKAGATYSWIVKQDAVGGRTISFGNNFKFPSAIAPVATSGANSMDLYSGLSDGSIIYMGAIFDCR
jgi:hypothetical protein